MLQGPQQKVGDLGLGSRLLPVLQSFSTAQDRFSWDSSPAAAHARQKHVVPPAKCGEVTLGPPRSQLRAFGYIPPPCTLVGPDPLPREVWKSQQPPAHKMRKSSSGWTSPGHSQAGHALSCWKQSPGVTCHQEHGTVADTSLLVTWNVKRGLLFACQIQLYQGNSDNF